MITGLAALPRDRHRRRTAWSWVNLSQSLHRHELVPSEELASECSPKLDAERVAESVSQPLPARFMDRARRGVYTLGFAPERKSRMELQNTISQVIGGLRIGSDVDTPTVLLKDVRAEAGTRLTLNRPAVQSVAEEVMVPDQRAELTPAQSVERKLTAMLQGGAAIPVSHFRLAKLCRKG